MGWNHGTAADVPARMRRLTLLGLSALLALSACARTDGPGTAATTTAPTVRASADDHTAILIAVLRRYLTTPGENSFPVQFADVYVIDHTDPHAANPMPDAAQQAGTALAADEQAAIIDGVADLGTVRFIADRSEVVVRTPEDPCGSMPDGAILVTLGEPQGTADRVEVGMSGWVSCLGATWLTYVVQRAGGQWRVSGTTGPIAIA
jgi:hypothetical protein